MSKPLDIQQKKLFELLKANRRITETLTLKEIGEQIGIDYAQGVINKLRQLENRGYIRKDEKGIYQVLKDPIEDIFYFPLIGFAHCGNLVETSLDDISEQERIPFPTKTLPIGSKEDLGKFFFTRAKGNSMEPAIYEDDLVLIKYQKEATESDKTLLVHNGTPKIKYLKATDGQYTLFSLNKHTDTLELSPKDEVDIIGVVKLVVSAR
ncbi:hypothetical protein AUK10_04280 [Candidatus Gracilibacteria bacterium CG2_30_37_12]|nr:MAG: hypothetical protein AUK10_04280 [Candidatus Gracilibacteria bacterium CG2_30_37_12]